MKKVNVIPFILSNSDMTPSWSAEIRSRIESHSLAPSGVKSLEMVDAQPTNKHNTNFQVS